MNHSMIYSIQFAATLSDFPHTLYGLHDKGPGVWTLSNLTSDDQRRMHAYGRRWLVENAHIPANTYRAYCVYMIRWRCQGRSRAAMPWEKCGLENVIAMTSREAFDFFDDDEERAARKRVLAAKKTKADAWDDAQDKWSDKLETGDYYLDYDQGKNKFVLLTADESGIPFVTFVPSEKPLDIKP